MNNKPKMVKIPAEFWRGLSAEEFSKVFMSGGLDAEQSRRLAQLLNDQEAQGTRETDPT